MQNEFEIYSKGFVAMSVCTSLSVEDATQRVNHECPSGTENGWRLSEDKYFADKIHENGCQCPDYPNNKHYLFTC